MAPSDAATDRHETIAPRVSVSPSEGWYLLYVSRLTTREDTRTGIGTGELAAQLDVSPASATEMAAKLADGSLLEYERYAGVDTTPQGEAIADSLAWRQCVVASFFDRVLAHAIDGHTAYRIGYGVPSEAVVRLRERIDHPNVDTCRRIHQGYDDCLVRTRVEG